MLRQTSAPRGPTNYEPPDRSDPKLLLVTDCFGNPKKLIDVKGTKDGKKLWAILDQSRRAAGSLGVIIFLPTSEKEARKQLKKTKHGRLVTLSHPLDVNNHCYGHEIVPESTARFG
jgi:hypothetical protein